MLSHFIQSSWGTGINAVTFPTTDFANVGDPIDGTIFSGVRFSSDGKVYRRTALGAFQSIGAWLLIGTNTTFFLSRTIDVGTLNTDSGTIQQMNANLDYDVQETDPGGQTLATVSFKIYDNNTETTQNGFPVSQAYSFDAFMRTP